MKRPAFQFYPGDWQRDAALRACSVGARGMWIEMMCVMHQADPYGYLVLNSNPIEAAQLARMVGSSEKEAARWMAELQSSGVFSMDDSKRIFSRRMVRDEELREKRGAGGILGGNPALVGSKVNGKVNHTPTINPTPSSSSSSSTSKESRTLSGTPDDAAEILKFLNLKANRNYKAVKANTEMIHARLSEGFTVADIKQVIAKKCREWINNDEMAEYVRPKTLFSRTNFANYAGELVEATDAS